MQTRRASRERLLQLLYQSQLTGQWAAGAPVGHAVPAMPPAPDGSGDALAPPAAGSPAPADPPDAPAFFGRLVEALDGRRSEIDARIQQASRNWRIERMAAVDLSILRLATAELLEGAAPPRVVINEAVELAKRFGDHGSATFVNGVLDGVHRAGPAE